MNPSIKNYLLIIVLSAYTTFSFGSVEPFTKYYTEKKTLKTFYKNGKYENSEYTLSHTKSGDTLILRADGPSSVEIKLTFRLGGGFCDYECITFSCDSCGIYYLTRVLKLHYCGWKKNHENSWLSNFYYQTELEVQQTETLCRKIIYKAVDKPKQVYKALYTAL